MEHHHYPDHRGWMVCVTPNGPPEEPRYLGHGVRATRPHDVVMAEAPTEAEARDELHRQIDAIEDAAAGQTTTTGTLDNEAPQNVAPTPNGSALPACTLIHGGGGSGSTGSQGK